jgi:hypothetical protein
MVGLLAVSASACTDPDTSSSGGTTTSSPPASSFSQNLLGADPSNWIKPPTGFDSWASVHTTVMRALIEHYAAIRDAATGPDGQALLKDPYRMKDALLARSDVDDHSKQAIRIVKVLAPLIDTTGRQHTATVNR